MSRWIDADALQDKAYKMNFDQRITERELALINYIIGTMPKDSSIDIVRCGECKHWNGDGVFTINALGEEEQLCKWWSKFGTIRTASTDYCSYGERRG